MADSFGDGWNGNDLTITDASGNNVGTFTIASGSAGQDQVAIGALQFVLLMDVPIQLLTTTIQQPTQMTVHVLMHVLEHLQHLTMQQLLGEMSNRLQ